MLLAAASRAWAWVWPCARRAGEGFGLANGDVVSLVRGATRTGGERRCIMSSSSRRKASPTDLSSAFLLRYCCWRSKKDVVTRLAERRLTFGRKRSSALASLSICSRFARRRSSMCSVDNSAASFLLAELMRGLKVNCSGRDALAGLRGLDSAAVGRWVGQEAEVDDEEDGELGTRWEDDEGTGAVDVDAGGRTGTALRSAEAAVRLLLRGRRSALCCGSWRFWASARLRALMVGECEQFSSCHSMGGGLTLRRSYQGTLDSDWRAGLLRGLASTSSGCKLCCGA